MVENLDTEILAGIPFMGKNDVSIRPPRREVILGDNHVYTYGSSLLYLNLLFNAIMVGHYEI